MESVLPPDAPQAFYLADGMYHFISRDPNIQMKNDSGAAGFPFHHCHVKPALFAQVVAVNFLSIKGT